MASRSPSDTPVNPDTAVLVAISRLVGRTGAESFQIRYSDDDKPVVWMAVATYSKSRAEAAAALTAEEAAWRLGEQLIDGGTCTHCRRRTTLVRPEDDGLAESLDACHYVLRGDDIVRSCAATHP